MSNGKINFTIELLRLNENLLPRILTQVCRDPSSSCYGSFDRDWWHYKIRDFSSIILQQAGYTLYLASQLPLKDYDTCAFISLVKASCFFWRNLALKYHSFE